jgi:hypothetical protein
MDYIKNSPNSEMFLTNQSYCHGVNNQSPKVE